MVPRKPEARLSSSRFTAPITEEVLGELKAAMPRPTKLRATMMRHSGAGEGNSPNWTVPTAAKQHAAGRRYALADTVGEPAEHRRQRHYEHGRRQQHQSGALGRVALDDLQKGRGKGGHSVDGRVVEQRRDGAGREDAVLAHQVQVEHRVVHAQLHQHEGGQQHDEGPPSSPKVIGLVQPQKGTEMSGTMRHVRASPKSDGARPGRGGCLHGRPWSVRRPRGRAARRPRRTNPR